MVSVNSRPWLITDAALANCQGCVGINVRRGLEVGDDVTENVSYRSAEQGHDDDDHNGHQHENQRVLNEPLTLFI